MKKIITSIICIFSFFINVTAQSLDADKLFRPRLFISSEYETSGDFKTIPAGFGFSNLSDGYSIPFLKKLKRTERNEINASIFSVKGNFVAGFPRTEIFFTNHTLINAAIGLNWTQIYHTKNIFSFRANALAAEDNKTIPFLQPRWNGNLFYSRLTSHHYSYTLGIAYTYLYGRGIILPVIGASIKTGEKSRVTVLLPFNIQYLHKLNSKISYKIFIKTQGSVNRFENEDSIHAFNPVLLLKQREGQLGFTFLHHPTSAFAYNISTGITFHRTMALSNNDSDFKTAVYNLAVSPGVFVHAGIVWTIPQKAKNKSSLTIDELDEMLDADPDSAGYLY